MLYNIDRRLHQIKHSPTNAFGDVDIIFFGELYEAQHVHDVWIFEERIINNEKIPHIWLDNVTCFKLHIVVRQTNQHFISILNHARDSKQTDLGILYLNKICCKAPLNDLRFSYLFQRNSIVDQHKKKTLNYLPTRPYVLEELDTKDTSIENIQFQIKKPSLPSTIFLKRVIFLNKLLATSIHKTSQWCK